MSTPFSQMPEGFRDHPIQSIEDIESRPDTQAWLDQQKATVRELIRNAVHARLAYLGGDNEAFLDACMVGAKTTAAMDRNQMQAALAVAVEMLAMSFLKSEEANAS